MTSLNFKIMLGFDFKESQKGFKIFKGCLIPYQGTLMNKNSPF